MTIERKLVKTSGATAEAVYVEEVFQTHLYTDTNSTQTINNGIDLATKGGMVWLKPRNQSYQHEIYDTARGNRRLSSNDTSAQTNLTGSGYGIGTFLTNGFTTNSGNNGTTYASWTFRKQPKFFDIVTYTGDGTSNRQIAHALGSTPGMIIVKPTSTTGAWQVWHRSLGDDFSNSYGIILNLTDAKTGNAAFSGVSNQTSTYFTTGSTATNRCNASGVTYVAYLFAHDAGGFGAAGTDSVVSCGSFTTDGSGNATVNLGWEPQFVIMKSSSASGDWYILDNMRGWTVTDSTNVYIKPNTSDVEFTGQNIGGKITPTGFNPFAFSSRNYIYLAIRRGPMKTPTDATKVFTPIARTGTSVATTITSGFVVDAVIEKSRIWSAGPYEWSRLQGQNSFLTTSNTASEDNSYTDILTSFANNTGVGVGADASLAAINNSNALFNSYINWMFSRAPGFFDVVCYTGTGSARTVAHNLGVAPELMIVRSRSRSGEDWPILSGQSYNRFMYLNQTIASALNVDAYNCFGNGSSITPPTSSVFTVGIQALVNANADTYVAYLFASCPGVSKVGSYTGNGSSQTIDCGFAAGARFVLIKRTDSTGNWYVWDTARGIVSGNDPYLLLNSSAAEVTNTDYIDPYSAGFEISSSAPAAINASGGTFIYLAIA
jgi:hypothetical protein